MNYEALYFRLLAERATTSGELHHIVPRHDGGTDNDGLVRLSRKDHTLAHYIRWRWLKQSGDLVAYKLMLGLPLNAMQIEEYRERHKKAVQKTSTWRQNIGNFRKGKTYEDLYGESADYQRSKRANKGSRNGMYGKSHSEETLIKIRQARSSGKILLITPQGTPIEFESKEALIKFGVHRDVIIKNLNENAVSKGKWKNYKIQTK